MNSSRVLSTLSVGVVANCVGQTALTVIQAAGRTDWIAKLHIAEVGPYLIVLCLGALEYGVMGVAVAWTLRAAIDAVLMMCMANRILREPAVSVARNAIALLAMCLLVILISLVDSLLVRVGFAAIIAVSCVGMTIGVYRAGRAEYLSSASGGA